jgi:mRNA interferase MazF
MAQARQGVTVVRRGDVYIVQLDPSRGSELKKTWPAVIIQNDVDNRYSPVTIIAPITSKFDAKLYPTQVLVKPPEGGLRTDSIVLLNQIRVVDKSRLGRRLGALKPATMALVNDAIAIALALIDI